MCCVLAFVVSLYSKMIDTMIVFYVLLIGERIMRMIIHVKEMMAFGFNAEIAQIGKNRQRWPAKLQIYRRGR